ncbi:MAG: trypsin-like peptidase domain-containing protein [Gammaproteobacteria bacterium]|nr:trypsin-like peptidase domain-containing protein [Gammaproteobacteria bacterium]
METIKTLLKYTLIGIAAAIIVLYFTDNTPSDGSSTVTFNEISIEEANKLAHSGRQNQQGVVSYSKAVKIASPAVVNIYTAKVVAQNKPKLLNDPLFEHFFGEGGQSVPRKRLETSLGSGVIISEQGFILTNNHVVEGADEIQIALKDGRNTEAVLIGSDPESDLAVLKIGVEDIPSITLGQSNAIEIGDVVLAIGNPFGVGQTVTMGIVSATGRDHLGLNTFENFIQTDAAINPGNSGGALINAYGHLIGINTAIFSSSKGSQGIGFAIPIDNAKQITEEIITHGHVVRGWIGIEIQNITTELAESFGLSDTNGVIVAGMLNKGPANQADLHPGDIIKRINGIDVIDGKHAINLISRSKPGKTIDVELLRNGKGLKKQVTTSQRPIIKKP